MFASELQVIDLKKPTSGFDLETALRHICTLSGSTPVTAEIFGITIYFGKADSHLFSPELDGTEIYTAFGVSVHENLAYGQLRDEWFSKDELETERHHTGFV